MSKTVSTKNIYAPDLVSVEEFGEHKSFVNRAATTRVWTFKSADDARKFEKAIQETPSRFIRGKKK